MKFNHLKRLIPLFIGVMYLSSCNDGQNEINYLKGNSDSVESSLCFISLEDAQTDLESILNDVYPADSRTGSSRKIKNAFSLPVREVISRSGEQDTSFVHIFNFDDNQGYAIMSGDTRVPSLLALAESGSINTNDAIDNPGLALFLEGMDDLYNENTNATIDTVWYEYPGGPAIHPIHTTGGPWENVVYKHYGWCPVKWNQNSPYNNYCPKENNQSTDAGCVATAVAQLMAIYRYPSYYNGYSFDWEAMTSSPFGYNCSTVGQENIARLMQQLGLKENLDMSYGTSVNVGGSGSGAEMGHSVRTLKNFGYSNGGKHEDYNTLTVAAELREGYSVFIGGFSHKNVKRFLGINISTKYSGGHQWLAHGLLERRRELKHYQEGKYLYSSYESHYYPLCNWGWSGYHDGYYLSTAFDSTKGPAYEEYKTSTRSSESLESDYDHNYQYKITAITGIRK